ncbi:MAG: PTS sugar transporter subunit IIA [Deltaproteobacteria bacterium]|nr:PTS sugar transporter subunit IIA [Deltaproteobacteria bacterium]
MTIKLSNIADKRLIQIGFDIKKRDPVLLRLIDMLVKIDPFEERDILFNKFIERESVMSTSIGSGIALPHIISDKIDNTLLVIGIDKDGIEYDKTTEPVKIVFMFIGPARNRESYLDALVRVSRLLKVEQNKSKLLNVNTPEDVMNITNGMD